MSQQLSAPCQLLVDGVSGLAAQCPTDLPGAQALGETAVLLRQLDVLKIVVLRRLADVDTRGLHALDASPSTSNWVANQHTGLGTVDVALARKLHRLPTVTDQLGAGTLPLPSAVLIGQALDKVRRFVDRLDGRINGAEGQAVLTNVIVEGVLFQIAEASGGLADADPRLHTLLAELTEILDAPVGQLDRLEAAFVLLARHLERQQLGPALEGLVDALLPIQLADAADRGHRGRGLTLIRKPDGSGWTLLRSDLDLECGAYLHAILTAGHATDPDNPTDTLGWAAARRDDARLDDARVQGARRLAEAAAATAGAVDGVETPGTTGNPPPPVGHDDAADTCDTADAADTCDMADAGEPDDMADAGADDTADAGKRGDAADGAEPGDVADAEPSDAANAEPSDGPDHARATAGADSGSADTWRPLDTPGDPHPFGPTPRSRPQRDHDAFKRGLRTLLDSGVLGSRHKAAPHLVITVGLAALHDEPGALPATLSNGTSLPAGLVRRLLADSYLTRVVLSLGRRVLETSHTERTLKAHERTALLTRWGSRCAGAGCTSQPGTPLIPHHANPWHRTGTTSLIDSVPFCASTHHDIHEGKQIIQLRDGRYLGPDGWASEPGP